jgi:DNA-binding CsgD family transcriptional regulator
MSVRQHPDLTEGQKACLRLVDDHHTSKEIARILGISPFTVDQRLDAARRKLNAESRKEAAKIFSSFDESISEPLVYEPQRVEHAAIADSSVQAAKPVGQIFSRFASSISVPPIGGARHKLSTKEILVQSLNIAFFGTLVIAVVIITLAGMMGLFA